MWKKAIVGSVAISWIFEKEIENKTKEFAE